MPFALPWPDGKLPWDMVQIRVQVSKAVFAVEALLAKVDDGCYFHVPSSTFHLPKFASLPSELRRLRTPSWLRAVSSQGAAAAAHLKALRTQFKFGPSLFSKEKLAAVSLGLGFVGMTEKHFASAALKSANSVHVVSCFLSALGPAGVATEWLNNGNPLNVGTTLPLGLKELGELLEDPKLRDKIVEHDGADALRALWALRDELRDVLRPNERHGFRPKGKAFGR